MQAIKQRSLSFFSLLLALVLLLQAAGCRKQELKDNKTAFDEAIAAGNYPLAADIYREASVREGFEAEEFAETLRIESEKIVTAFRQGRINFDKADLALQALTFSDELNELLAADFEAAKAAVSPGENIEEALQQAALFAEAGDYESSLQRYDAILEDYPEHAETRSGRSTVLGAYIDLTEKQSKDLEKEGYPRTAMLMVERALGYDPENQVLLSRKKDLQQSISDTESIIKAQIPVYELGLLLDEGDLKGAEAYIEKVSGEIDEKTADKLQLMLEEEIDRYVEALIKRAGAEAAEDIEGRWPASPYARAIHTLNEGLALYPENAALISEKAAYEAKTPVNVSGKIRQNRGSITVGATGTNASGYTYSKGNFDTAVLSKPDMNFSYNSEGYGATLIKG